MMPDSLCARMDLPRIKILNIFKYIRSAGNISGEEMLRTFNWGVDFISIVPDFEITVSFLQPIPAFPFETILQSSHTGCMRQMLLHKPHFWANLV